MRESSFAAQAIDYGYSTTGELADIAAAFRDWSAEPTGVFVVTHVEVVARTAR